jgi:hypothetical protein
MTTFTRVDELPRLPVRLERIPPPLVEVVVGVVVVLEDPLDP